MVVSIFEIMTPSNDSHGIDDASEQTDYFSSIHPKNMRVNSTGHHISSVPNVTGGFVLFEFITA